MPASTADELVREGRFTESSPRRCLAADLENLPIIRLSGGFPTDFQEESRIVTGLVHGRDMCDMCDGATLDESRFKIFGIIDRYGWFIQYVEAAPGIRPWAYTIGLSAGFSHPELVICAVKAETAARVLNGIGEMIRGGERFGPEDCLVDPAGGHIHLSEVHSCHFERGVFARWVDYYGALGPLPPPAEALEVVLPGRKAFLASSWSPIG